MLLLNSSVLTMDGGGSVNLGDETLALRLRPQGRVAGTVIVVPLQVTGPIRSPAVKVNAVGTAEANAVTVPAGNRHRDASGFAWRPGRRQ